MATLEKIRSKGVLLLIVVGLALFAFIIGDFLNSGATYFNQSRETVAEIAGEEIHINDYAMQLEQMMEVYKIETGQADLNEELSAQLRNSVWESLVLEKTLGAEADKIGLTVSGDELSSRCFGNNVHPIIAQRRSFFGPNGQFSSEALVQFLSSLDQEPGNAEMEEQLRQAKSYWMFWENNLRSTLLQEKYTNLITKTVSANSLDAKKNFEMNKATVDVEYVVKPYYAVADSLVKVSESDVRKLYNNRKETYKQEPNRDIKYIAFDIVPSTDDFEEVEKWINNLKPEFTTTTDVAGVVNSNSDVLYDGRNYSEATVPANYKEFAFAGKAGDVSEITFEDNTYRMARIVEAGYAVSDSVQLRHILVQNDDVLADSIVKAVKGGADFGALALKYSLVQETAAKGGEIGWVQEMALPKELSEPAFAKRAKEVFSVSTPGQGIQIVQIMAKSKATPKVKLAILEREVTPTSRTYSKLYNDAKQFVVENNTADKFTTAAAEQELTVMPAAGLNKNAQQVANLSASREIVRWLFNSDKGDVSDVFECGDTYVVAVVADTHDGEYRAIQDVAYELRAELTREEKAKVIKEELKGVLEKDNTLAAVAAFVKDDVQKAEAVSFSSYQFGNAGVEPYVLGAALAMAENTISEPIEGRTGVYVIKAGAKIVSDTAFDKDAQIEQLNMRNGYYLGYQLIDVIRRDAEIVDNRSVFY